MTGKVVLVVLSALTFCSCSFFDSVGIKSDADFIIAAIRDNYPYLNVHRTRDNFDWVKAVSFRREAIALPEANIEARGVYFGRLLEGLNAHVGIIDQQFFRYICSLPGFMSSKDSEYAPWREVLGRSDVRRAYDYSFSGVPLLEDAPVAGSRGDSFAKSDSDGIVYIRVPTFDRAVVETEGPRIVDYLRTHAKSEKKIVIDIRGNGGGSDQFWMDWIVKPLIGSRLSTQPFYTLYKGGQDSLPFLKAKNVQLVPTGEAVAALTAFSDLDNYKFYSVSESVVLPSDSPVSHSTVIVLMDRDNFSSSESFVAFCKSSRFAITVGQRSGGDGVGFDPILVELPYSHLLLRIPICAALNSEGRLNYEYGTQPDISLSVEEDSLQYVKEHVSLF